MPLVFFVFLILLSTGVGYGVARIAPWRSNKHFNWLAWPLALALGPFILGLFIILVLIVASGAQPQMHLWFLIGCLTVVAGLLAFGKPRWHFDDQRLMSKGRGYWPLVFLFFLGAVVVLFLAWRLPLTENDALEYGLVGRAIYEARSLSMYPLLDTNAAASGFFAPWTHPPLYPSMVYVAYALQGHADMAGWMKFIAPWFMLSAAAGVIGMGRMQGVRTAWMAGSLFIGMPLLAMGAETAAIDALPVAGMTLLLLGLVGLNRESRWTPLYLGFLIGLALWTHSQAILYLPIMMVALMVTGGLSRWGASLRLAGMVFLVALLVAGYPYLRNIGIYGTPISDNPAVFALPSLDWDGFFKYTRSIYDWSTRLQYGLLKGFIAVHNYGFVFWLGLLALVCLLRTGTLRRWWADVYQMRSMDGSDGAMLISLAVLGTYYGGVLASMLIGTDLMIKNDRYLLVIAPAVSLLAAGGIQQIMRVCRKPGKQLKPKGTYALVVVAATLLLAHAAAFLLYGNLAQWLQLLDIRRPEPSMSLEVSFRKNPLEKWHGIQISQNLHRYVPPEVRVLAIRPADMYYAQRRMVSYLDPIMLPLYEQKDVYQLYAQLLAAGIEFIQMPIYFIPPVANSSLMELLSNSELTTLVQDTQFSQLYALKRDQAEGVHDKTGEITDLSAWSWLEYPRVGIGGPAFELRSWISRVVRLPNTSISSSSFLAKSYSHTLEVGGVGESHTLEGTRSGNIDVVPGKEYVIDLHASGEGFNRALIWLRGSDSEVWSGPFLAGDFVLSPKVPSLRFQRRMRVPEGMKQIRIGIERYGISRLTIDKALLTHLPE